MASKTEAADARKAATRRLLAQLADQRVRTVGELFRDAGVRLDKPTVGALAAGSAVLVRNVKTATLAELESVHVAAREAAAAALESDAVLVGILRRLAITGKSRAHTTARLVQAVGAKEQPAFRAALTARVEQRRWPDGVGAVVGAQRTVLVFLLDDVMGNVRPAGSRAPARAPTTPTAPTAPTARVEPNGDGFAGAFDAAFDHLKRQRGRNLVELSALRSALSDWPRDAFDRELYALRRANLFVLETFDGRHGKPRPEDLAGAIEEDGRRFVYATRREHD